MDNQLRIIVSGYLMRFPLGGNAWVYLQYVLGLSQLGHDVYYVEDSGESLYGCYNPVTNNSDADPGYGLNFAQQCFAHFGLQDRYAYFDAHNSNWFGPCADRIEEICNNADMYINVSGVDLMRPWFESIPVRVLIDTDPVFTPIIHLTNNERRTNSLRYNNFYSFGENISRGSSSVPDDGLPWLATRPPIVLDAWPFLPGKVTNKFTTIMKWESYPAGEYEGVQYGMKAESFAPYMDLHGRV